MEAILQWDGQALLFIQEHIRQVWMDGFWKTITHLGDAGWFWIILGIVLLIPKKTRKAGIAALAALAIGALITNVALKNIIARIRPYEVVEGLKILIEPQSDFFVSFRTYLCLYWSSVGDVSVFGEKVGDSACNSGSADLTFQVVCGRALSDGCARWSCCGSAGCMGSGEDCEAKGNKRK